MSNSNRLTGKVLGLSRYSLEKQIKRSKMSTVYQGIDLKLQRLVAVKVIHANLDREFLIRFQREASVMAQLDHTNIIPIFDYGEQNGINYLVMPYLPKGSLQNVLDQHGIFTLEEAYKYIKQAANALDYAHMHGVIHRDLKPANFLLHTDGRLILTDFGIARMMRNPGNVTWSTLTDVRTLIGTPGYMAPETIRSERVDLRADIYALGVVLYQMLSGDIPFKGDTYSILLQQLQGEFPLLHQLNSSIPSEVDVVIRRATAQEREDRYTSAAALVRALQHAVRIVNDAPDSHSRVLHLRHTSQLQSNENIPLTQKASSDLRDQPLALATDPNVSTRPALPSSRVTHPIQNNRKSYRITIVTILTIVLIICGLLLNAAMIALQGSHQVKLIWPPPPTQITMPPPSQQAEDTVKNYYSTWNRLDYRRAYSQLGSKYQKMHPYSTLSSSYENTLHSSIKIDSITQLPDGTFKVTVTDFAIEKSLSGTQTVSRVYYGYYIVAKENSTWKLTPHFNY